MTVVLFFQLPKNNISTTCQRNKHIEMFTDVTVHFRILPVVRFSNVFEIIIQIPVSCSNGVTHFKVEFSVCLSTVHVLHHAYFRFDEKQSQHLQNVQNVTYVAMNVIFAWKVTLFFINPFSTETVLLVGYWSPITNTLLYT